MIANIECSYGGIDVKKEALINVLFIILVITFCSCKASCGKTADKSEEMVESEQSVEVAESGKNYFIKSSKRYENGELVEMSEYEYDKSDNLIGITIRNMDGEVIGRKIYEYFENGNTKKYKLVSFSDGEHVLEEFNYDEAGNVVYDGALEIQYIRDVNGRCIEEKRSDGSTFYKYDAEGRCIEWNSPDDSMFYMYQTDSHGNITKCLSSEGDGIWTEDYECEYDELERLIKKKRGSSMYEYEYDSEGNKKETIYINNVVEFVREYDETGNCTKEFYMDKENGKLWLREESIYDKDGLIKNTRYNSDGTTEFFYQRTLDEKGRTVSVREETPGARSVETTFDY